MEVFMIDDLELKRTWAVQRFLDGEKPEAICASLGCSKAWLYKWINRCLEGDPFWVESLSRPPLINPTHTSPEIEEVVKLVRLNLYNQDLFCRAQAINWEMEDLGVQPLPSLRTINRILSRRGLTHRRTGRYESKGALAPDAVSSLIDHILSLCRIAWIDNLEIHDVAAGLSHGLGIPAVDSLILAGFLVNGSETIYTTDAHLEKCIKKGVRVIKI
jgi:hypothetical protein